jgi:hypothetical protein
MAESTRIKGKYLLMKLGTPGTDYKCDVTSWTLAPGDPDTDTVTYCNPDGETPWTLSMTAIQSTDTESFWTYAWEQSGETVPFTAAPWGNAEPTDDQPHFIGMVKIGRKPSIGGEAGSQTTHTFELEWEVESEPTKVGATTEP